MMRICVKSEILKAGHLIETKDDFVIVGHIRPDGDAVGSLLALSRCLQQIGKQVVPVLVDGVPETLTFIADTDEIRTEFPSEYGALIAVDVSDLGRLGIDSAQLNGQPDLNIDHHPTNTNFAAINIVQPTAAATTQILYDFILQLELPLDPQIATHLMLGLVTDTIGFRTSNVSAKTLSVAAALIDQGAALTEVYQNSLNRRSYAAARYWGQGLTRLERHNGVVITSLTLEDRKIAGYPGIDDADLINVLSTIEEAEVAILLVEQEGGSVKISWRSKDHVNVAELATSFGGGGHLRAAGAIISGDLATVKQDVLAASLAAINGVMELDK
jgi:phosphoesterase RecJ-like protein